jgi:hypothetical protein
MYKLKPLVDTVLKTRRSKEDRAKNHIIASHKMIQQYIKDGSKGMLDLRDSPITELPDELLLVGGSLVLAGTNITKLPNGLHVGGNVFLQDSKIRELPNDLHVKGRVFLNRTPLSLRYSRMELITLLTGVEGMIYV